MTIELNTFAEACYNMNSIQELEEALNQGPDQCDMDEWGISADEWKEQISAALAEKRIDAEAE